MRNPKNRYVGWLVLYEDLRTKIIRRFYRAPSEAEARQVVKRMNALRPDRLYWCEWWSTSSSLHDESGRDMLTLGSTACPGVATLENVRFSGDALISE